MTVRLRPQHSPVVRIKPGSPGWVTEMTTACWARWKDRHGWLLQFILLITHYTFGSSPTVSSSASASTLLLQLSTSVDIELPILRSVLAHLDGCYAWVDPDMLHLDSGLPMAWDIVRTSASGSMCPTSLPTDFCGRCLLRVRARCDGSSLWMLSFQPRSSGSYDRFLFYAVLIP